MYFLSPSTIDLHHSGLPASGVALGKMYVYNLCFYVEATWLKLLE